MIGRWVYAGTSSDDDDEELVTDIGRDKGEGGRGTADGENTEDNTAGQSQTGVKEHAVVKLITMNSSSGVRE